MIYFEYTNSKNQVVLAGQVASEADLPEIPEGAAVNKIVDLSASVTYAVFDADGNLLRDGVCPRELVPLQAQDGEVSREVDALSVFAPPEDAHVTYAAKRMQAYPTVEEQLDTIYHEGIDAWREQIKAVKDEFPKDSTY